MKVRNRSYPCLSKTPWKIPSHLEMDLVHLFDQVVFCCLLFVLVCVCVYVGETLNSHSSTHTHTICLMFLIVYLINIAISLFPYIALYLAFIYFVTDKYTQILYKLKFKKIKLYVNRIFKTTNIEWALAWIPKATIFQTYLGHKKLGHLKKIWKFYLGWGLAEF